MILRCLRTSRCSLRGLALERAGKNEDVAFLRCESPFVVNEQITQALRLSPGSQSPFRAVVVTGLDALPIDAYHVHDGNIIDVIDAIASSGLPTIASAEGRITGAGTEMALACDIVYASDAATFAIDQILHGFMPGAGGTSRLSRSVGKSLAMEMALSGEAITAPEAKAAGLVSRIFPSKRLQKESLHRAEILAGKSPLILQMARNAVLTSLETNLREGLATEAQLFEATFTTKDREEGMRAHLEGRPPQWKGE